MDYFVLRFDHGYEKSDFLVMQKLYQKITRSWWKRILEALMLFAGVIVVIDAILLLSLGNIGQGLFSLGFGLLLALIFLLRTRINAWISRRNTPRMENLTLKFSDTELTEKYSGVVVQMPYSGITRMLHYRGYYFLFIDKRRAHILPERSFAVGDPSDFRAFIEGKTGKPVEYI